MKFDLIKLYILIFCSCIFFITSCSVGDLEIDSGYTCSNCKLEPQVGPCNAAFSRYYFDQEENKCKVFTWGGCNGVVPFETLEDCELCACGS